MAKIESMVHNKHEQLYFNIIEISQRLEVNIKLALKPYKLTHAQFNILRILKGAKNTQVSAKIIKKKMIVKNPDVTRLIDRLVKKELVIRQINPSNKRQIFISLTKQGYDMIDLLNPIMYKAVHNFFQDSISSEQANSALDVLNIINLELNSSI